MAGVKIDVGEPFPDTPNQGIFVVNAELTPLADSDFEPGPPGPEAIELARVVDRTLREGNVIDLESLTIKEGELVWKVMIDIYVYSNDGNLYDASYLASLLALKNAVFPKLDENYRVKYGEKTENKLALKNPNVYLVSVAKVDDVLVLDPNKIEEEIAEVILHIGTDGKKVYSLQKRGEGFISLEDVKKSLELAKFAVNNVFLPQKWKTTESLKL